MPSVRRSSEKATKLIHEALALFEVASGLTPLVVLLPRRVFEQYSRERRLLDSVLPDSSAPRDPREWADVRVVEHERIEEIEVY